MMLGVTSRRTRPEPVLPGASARTLVTVTNSPAPSSGRWVTYRGRRLFIRDWVSPPARVPGRGVAGGFTATGQTNTSVGDLGEALLVEHLGLRSLLPPGKRQNPLDLVDPKTGDGYEVKVVTTAAKEYKIKMKAAEVRSKEAYAKKNKLRPNMMMVIMDADRGEAYAYSRPGIGSYRLTEKDWTFRGKVSLGTPTRNAAPGTSSGGRWVTIRGYRVFIPGASEVRRVAEAASKPVQSAKDRISGVPTAENVNDAEHEAVEFYQLMSPDLNTHLRKNKDLTAVSVGGGFGLSPGADTITYKDVVARLDSAIADNRAEQALITYRGVQGSKRTFDVGDTFSDKGFMSTSLDSTIADDFVGSLNVRNKPSYVLKISLPAGHNALYLDKATSRKHIGSAGTSYESTTRDLDCKEVLLPRGIRLKVTGVTERTINIRSSRYRPPITVKEYACEVQK